MKTMNKQTGIILTFAALLASLLIFSCENTLALGARLDLNGPVVEITAPVARKAISTHFTLEGTSTGNKELDRLLIKAVLDNEEYAKHWRYYRGSWQVSEDYGVTWNPFEGAIWDGNSKSGSWTVEIDLSIAGVVPENGEYTFVVQAWDSANMSDDNSYKTIVLIYDSNPPSVQITDPYLYISQSGAE
jgi:hypothetical protein